MKKLIYLLAVLGLTMALVGCGGKGKVDTAPLEKSFAGAEAATKAAVDKAVAAIKEKNYSAAVTELQKLSAKAKLTPEQREAIKKVVEQLNEIIAKGLDKAAKEAAKAAEGVPIKPAK
jgi:predicted small lipoprotein YifL